VGGSEKVQLDVRLIVATQKSLAEEVKKGNFREDLYYRMMGLTIELPPLRERGSDILILAKYFADDFSRENKLGAFHFSDDAKEKLLNYHYPGNVRELKALIDLASVMTENNVISAGDIVFTPPLRHNELFSTEKKTLRQHTCDIIKYYLKNNDNDVSVTSRILDIGKSTIYKMLQSGELE
jgi:DNA-binding NtrC family response regulator